MLTEYDNANDTDYASVKQNVAVSFAFLFPEKSLWGYLRFSMLFSSFFIFFQASLNLGHRLTAFS